MSRRRMYAFERAYVDFGARFSGARRRLVRAGRGVWLWMWEGPGARAIEVLLRLAIIASGVALAYLYLDYERSQGRGFSAGTVVPMGAIFLYVTVLLWGWKAPVHFVARVTSGASAAGVVLLLSFAALIVAIVVFLGYLAALFAFTAASLLVFLPMRAGQEAWLLYRRIAYRCPYDDCSSSGLPIHICSCGERYADLLPSFYGIFNHSCRHRICSRDKSHVPVHTTEARCPVCAAPLIEVDHKLPTLDISGRKALARLCSGCQRPLIHSSIGEVPEWPIAVVGGASAGKTVFLIQAARALRDQIARTGGLAQIDSPVQQQAFERQLAQLDRGQVVAKTAGDVMTALGLAVRMKKKQRCLLYLYDAPGEDFASMKRFGQKQSIQHLRGIVLLVDPFSLPMLSEHARRARGDLKPSETPFRDVVGNLIHSVNLMLLDRPDRKCDVPVAVVLSKSDAFPAREFPFLVDLLPANGGLDERAGERCRAALMQLGEGASLRALDQKFSNVHFFACSALGRIPAFNDTAPFMPAGVVQPFEWLLQSTGQPLSH